MKRLILGFMIVVLFIPTASHAFSFSDLFWWRNKEVVEEEVVGLTAQQKIVAQEKLTVWSEAYIAKNLSLITRDVRYMTISEAEFNFILQEQLSKYNNPPIQDITVSLLDGKLILEGYALKPFKGKVYLEMRIEVMDQQLYFHVTKARYKGLFIPGSLVGRLIYGYLEPVSAFFFTDEAVKLQDIVIDGGNIDFVID